MSQVSTIIERIRSFASLPGMSKTKVSIEAGLSKNALRDLDKEDVNLTSDTIKKVEELMARKEYTSQSDGVGS